jgi:sortase B
MRSKKITNLLIILCAAVFAVSAFGLSRELRTRSQGRSFYATVLAGITTRASAPSQGANRPIGTEGYAAGTPWIPYVDFYALQETIPGITAWIVADGTIINYPVMQWTNNDHFLNHLPDGTRHIMGSIFLDYRNSPDFTDKNSVIYGHHMRSGDMFSQLEFYKEQEFYDRHPIIMLYTPERDYRIELFAGYVADALRETIPVAFSGASDFEAYIAEARRRSVFESSVDVGANDRLVTLVTCTHGSVNARFVLVGRIVDES